MTPLDHLIANVEPITVVGALLFLLAMLLFLPGLLVVLGRKEPAPLPPTRAVSSARKSGRTR